MPWIEGNADVTSPPNRLVDFDNLDVTQTEKSNEVRPMRSRMIVGIILFALYSRALQAQVDGTWWRDSTPASQSTLVTGMATGAVVLGERVFSDSMLSQVDPKGPSAAVDASITAWLTAMKPYEHASQRFFKGLNLQQVAAGITTFYGDFRNMRIDVVDAFWVVLNQLKGTPDSNIQTMIEAFRSR